jgi:hypothetical protein
MFGKSLAPVWAGIILLSGMFLMGQDSWENGSVENYTFNDPSLSDWTVGDLWYSLQGNTPYVSGGVYLAGDGTAMGGHHKLLENPLNGSLFTLESSHRSRNVYGVGVTKIGLCADNEVHLNDFGGYSADCYFISAGSYSGRVSVSKMENGVYTLLAQTVEGAFPQDETFHDVIVTHLPNGRWRIWVENNEATLGLDTEDTSPLLSNLRYISLSLDINGGTEVNALDNITVTDNN